MERRVKERLLGATMLLALVVLIVPELLSGPKRPTAPPSPPTTATVHTVTVDLTHHATTAEPTPMAAAAGAPTELPSAAAPALESAPATPLESAPRAAPTPSSEPPAHAALPAPIVAAPAGPSREAAGGAWAVQLGSFAGKANADKLVHALKGEGYRVYVSSSGAGDATRYRVRVGPLADRDAAERSIAKLKAHGHAATVVSPAQN